MKSAKRGKTISRAEVSNVSEHGLWLLVGGRELFLAFEHFPWFRDASLKQVFDVELAAAGHLYWRELDLDLSVASIETPADFPLVAKVRERAPRWAGRKTSRRAK
jgi:hypothetical protein